MSFDAIEIRRECEHRRPDRRVPHAKWLSICNHLSWRRKIASLNLLITSTVWRQDHNGFTHQDPGFLDVVLNKSAAVTRIYLPPDANCLLSVADHCLRSENYINVIVSDKQKHLQYLDIDAAITHCTKGIGIWNWASNDAGQQPDVVFAAAGDIPTQEALAAIALLRERFPDLRIRFINVVDLFKLQPSTEHPHVRSHFCGRRLQAFSGDYLIDESHSERAVSRHRLGRKQHFLDNGQTDRLHKAQCAFDVVGDA